MIVNSLSWRIGRVYSWSHIYYTHQKFYHLVFFNKLLISSIIQNIFNKKFFTTSPFGFSFIRSKILSFSSDVTILIFLNQSLKLKTFFFRKLIKFLVRFHKKKSGRKRQKIKKKKILFNKIFLSKFLRFSIFFFYYLPFFIKLRELIFCKVSKILNNKANLSIYFITQKSHFIDLELIGSLIKNLFKQRKSLSFVTFLIKKILQSMRDRGEISGFKYLFAGRFTRRDRAVYKWEIMASSLPFSSKTSSIEYLCTPVLLRYGACSIHLWINR